jgi:hypothetical protein
MEAVRPHFTRWLKEQSRRPDRVGDLARDVRLDSHWPPCRTLGGFRRYLEEHNACRAAVDTLAIAWAEWTTGR